MNETEILKKFYAAINRNEIPAILEFCAEDIVRTEPKGHATAGVWRGHKELLAHVSEGRGTWAEGTCEPESFKIVGDKVIAFLYVHVLQKNKTEWIEGRFADVFTFKAEKIIAWQTFWENEEAIQWVEAHS